MKAWTLGNSRKLCARATRRTSAAAPIGIAHKMLIQRWPMRIRGTMPSCGGNQWLKTIRSIKDIAPSTALRKWFGHDPARWQEFRSRYAVEFHEHPAELSRLRALARQGPITLVYSAHDEVHNDAVALRDFLLGRQTKRKPETASSRP